MATRKKTTVKTPEIIAKVQAQAEAALENLESGRPLEATFEVEVEQELKPAPKKGEPDFSLVQQVLAHFQLKSGDTAEDKISIIALKFYQRINKLPITGKLDEATLKDMGLN